MKATKSPPEAAGQSEYIEILDAGDATRSARRPRRMRQADVCAAKLPTAERTRFKDLLAEGGRLIAEGWKLRNEAWSIYRRYVPTAPRTEVPQSQSPRRAKSAK